MLAPHRITDCLIQLYSISTTTLWAYDYFLTVGDEVGVSGSIEQSRREADHLM